MNILITGINGFLGRNIAKLLSRGGHKIKGIGNSATTDLENICTYFQLSVLDQESLNELIRDVDIVIHLAAITAHKEIIDNKYRTLEVNLSGTRNILEAFNSSKRTKKFIYASTGKVYGKINNLPIKEEYETNPINILGKSKLIAEKLIDFYSEAEKTYVIFRIFQAYGNDQKNNFLIPTILSQIDFSKNQRQSITLGDINAKRDYVFIEDIANAFSEIVNSNISEGLKVFNLASSIPTSAREIVALIESLYGLNIDIEVNKKLLRLDEEDIEYGSIEKVFKELKWKPLFSLEQGLIKTIKQSYYS